MPTRPNILFLMTDQMQGRYNSHYPILRVAPYGPLIAADDQAAQEGRT